MGKRFLANVDTYVPADGARYYYYNLQRQNVAATTMKSSHLDISNCLLGNMHETERAAEIWAEQAESELRQLMEDREARSALDRLQLNFDFQALVQVSTYHLRRIERATRERLTRKRR